jgi:TPR repeat protein
MPAADELKSKRIKRYTWLTISCSFILAFMWPLGSFIVWPLIGAIAYFIFLIFYNLPQKEKYYRPKGSTEYSRPVYESTSRPPSQMFNVGKLTSKNIKLIIVVSVIVFISIFFILIIIGITSGDSYDESGDKVTIEGYKSVLADDPKSLDALTELGNSFFKAEQYDSALKYYNRILEIDPTNSAGMYNIGLVYYNQQEYQKSINILRNCTSLNPEYAEAYLLLGDNYYTQDINNDAIYWYRLAHDKGSRNSAMLNILGYLYDQQNNYSDAIKFYKEAIGYDSTLVDVYNRLAELDPQKANWYRVKAAQWQQ